MSNKPVNIPEIYERFPTQESCIKRLEQVKWNGHPVCPYCFSDQIAREKSQNRQHCNNCNSSFSVTVNTIFHNSKLPLQKWFLAITLILNAKKGISAKQLQRDLKVTYKTAWYLAMRIRRAMVDQNDLLRGIVEMDETYVGGKPRKQNKKGKQTPNKLGRGTKKILAVGMIERGTDNSVVVQVQKTIGADDLFDLFRQKVNTQYSTIITDQFRGYAKLNQVVKHLSIDHSKYYSIGDLNTNTIESFRAILKHGIVGQFRQFSKKFLPLYLAEFSYRIDNRNNDGVFDLMVANSVSI